MDFNEYVNRTRETVIYAPEVALHYLIPGLLVEAVELLNATMADVPKEAGDVCWFCARLLDEFGATQSLCELVPLRFDAGYMVARAAKICDLHIKAVRAGRHLNAHEILEISKELVALIKHIAGIAALYNLTLSDIMQANVDKLADRKVRGVLSGSGDSR